MATLKRHPLVIYFLLAYTIAWGGILLVTAPGGIPAEGTVDTAAVLPVALMMLIGPSVAGLALTALLDGREGLHALGSRLGTWRVNVRWYAVALLTTPILLLAILYAPALVSPTFVPGIVASSDKGGVLGFGLAAGLLAGFFEEIGWTGFALPRLRKGRSVLAAGLILGVLWGAWHLLGDFWGNAASYGALWPLRGLLWVAALTAYRVLIAWVYEHTGSLLVAQLMHGSFTGFQGVLGPATGPGAYVLWYGIFAAALWGILAVVAVRMRQTQSVRLLSEPSQ